jgi:hypothetical protein
MFPIPGRLKGENISPNRNPKMPEINKRPRNITMTFA